MIVIYADDGASSVSVEGLRHYYSKSHQVVCLSGQDIQTQDWQHHAAAFMIPGGRSLPFYEKLGAVGNQKIIDFVASGGTYVGFCAGAYYAAAETIFAKGLPYELILKGGLPFFAGAAIGPAFLDKKFEYESEQGACLAEVVTDENHYHIYFNGGCYFDLKADKVTIIAHYASNLKPAIIQKTYQKGRIILSGAHPELGFKSIPEDENLHHRALRAALIKHEQDRLDLLQKIVIP